MYILPVYVYCTPSEQILVWPCSTFLFDHCSTLSDPFFNISVQSGNPLLLFEHTFLHTCPTLVQPLARRPCSTGYSIFLFKVAWSLPKVSIPLHICLVQSLVCGRSFCRGTLLNACLFCLLRSITLLDELQYIYI